MIEAYQIPIPSLEVQAEIVRILDSFTELTAELTAELEARKKQYTYYRERLLTFEDGEVEWKSLGEVCSFKNGFAFKSALFRESGSPIIRITNITGTSIDLTSLKYFDPSDYSSELDSFQVKEGDLLIAMSGATTGKVGYYTDARVSYLNQRVGKFIPDSELILTRYLYHILQSKTVELYVLAGGGAQPNLSSSNLLKKIIVPVPTLERQKHIIAILDSLDTLIHSISEGLPREIALRQKQYEYYREGLLAFEN